MAEEPLFRLLSANGEQLAYVQAGPGYGMSWGPDGVTRSTYNVDGSVERSFEAYPPATDREVVAQRLMEADRDCRVYWGSHGCHLERGHKGTHRCFHDGWEEDDETPEKADSTGYGWRTQYFGEDAPRIQIRAWLGRHLPRR